VSICVICGCPFGLARPSIEPSPAGATGKCAAHPAPLGECIHGGAPAGYDANLARGRKRGKNHVGGPVWMCLASCDTCLETHRCLCPRISPMATGVEPGRIIPRSQAPASPPYGDRSWSFYTVVFPSWSLGTRWMVELGNKVDGRAWEQGGRCRYLAGWARADPVTKSAIGRAPRSIASFE